MEQRHRSRDMMDKKNPPALNEPICNEEHYNAVLERLSSFQGRFLSEEEAEEREDLLALLADYEALNHPIASE